MSRCVLCVLCCLPLITMTNQTDDQRRSTATQAFKDGNFKDACAAFRQLVLESPRAGMHTAEDLGMALESLRALGLFAETDELLESAVQRHPDDWRVLAKAAELYGSLPPTGTIVAGVFERGPHRGGQAVVVSAAERDRVRSLQLYQLALQAAKDQATKIERGEIWFSMAARVAAGRTNGEARRLLALTDLTTLPDYEPYQFLFRGGMSATRGAPVDEAGNPVVHRVPAAWEKAATDGERWRWCLTQAASLNPQRTSESLLIYATFVHSQFGVQTLGSSYLNQDEMAHSKDGPWNVHTLTDNEAIARLATGPRRFALPDDANHIALFRTLAAGNDQTAHSALDQLVQVYLNRRQYPRAAELLRDALRRWGDTNDHRTLLQRIVGLWGRFENTRIQPAGRGATVDFRYRNAAEVRFEAREIKVDALLSDIREHLRSNPQRLDGTRINIGAIGYRIVQNNETKYLGKQVAAWNQTLSPPADHSDEALTVTTPLQQAGAYLLTATIPNGNISRIIVWLTDAAIVRKNLQGQTLYFLADATTGAPLPGARIDLFGYKQTRVNRQRYSVSVRETAARTDADGLAILAAGELPGDHQWLASAQTAAGSLALLGFERVWYGSSNQFLYNQNKVYFASDRPVYRPGQTVHYQFWARNPRFDGSGRSFANQAFELIIRDGRGLEILKKQVTADELGNYTADLQLPRDATLGTYQISLQNQQLRAFGNGSFRVEQYRKPEYEVSVRVPDRPVQLGDSVPVTVEARYYFGAPVTSAQVHIRVTRTAVSERWYPAGPWDWLYGRGYGWFSVSRPWYPRHDTLACLPPAPWWMPQRPDPPEVVLDRELAIGPDGTVSFNLETSAALALHGDRDHRYQVTAEVTDRSRRTIVGDGTLLAGREPFQVTVWTSRGHFRTGDPIDVHIRAGSLDGRPVDGRATVQLMKVTFDDNAKPSEQPVATAEVTLDGDGQATHRFRADLAGQYRVHCEATDTDGRSVAGGELIVVRGADEQGGDFRFNDLELLADQRTYQPGDKARLLVGTRRLNGTVLLFVRPEGAVYPRPQVLKLQGRTWEHTLTVLRRDQPNFFVEALTVSDGRLHSVAREIFVPPAERVVEVQVQPGQQEYQPGEEAAVTLRLTDADGRPVQVPTTISVYDKSVEYISGGGNTADLREFFWKIRRSHSAMTSTNLTARFQNLLKRGEGTLTPLGSFGGSTRFLLSGRERMSRDDAAVPETAVAMRAAGDAAAPAGGELTPVVRRKFADTAFWQAKLIPDQDGTARVKFRLPDDLATWKIRTWSVDSDARVGSGEAEFLTNKKLLVRLQTPRFLVERDETQLSAIVHSDLDDTANVRVRFELDGEWLQTQDTLERTVTLQPGAEALLNWTVRAARPGEAVLRVFAVSANHNDAVEQRLPVLVHGMLKTESWTGTIPPGKTEAAFDILVPQERRAESTRLTVRYSPSLAAAMVDALPYLVDSPHHSSDATLHRFVPTIIVQRILQQTGVDLDAVRNKRANLNAAQLGAPAARAKQWKLYDRNPVFSNDEVNALVRANLQAVLEMQLADGGWGWFSGWGEHSTPYMTAIIVHGLLIAQANDVPVPEAALQRGLAWLQDYQTRQVQRLQNHDNDTPRKPRKAHADNTDALVFMVLTEAEQNDGGMQTYLYRDRTQLTQAAQCMLGLALHQRGQQQELDMILRNLSQFVEADHENQTSWLRVPRVGWWTWYGNDLEANAWYLKLLARTDPDGPVAAGLARYLVNNRRNASWWRSVRDTALAVEALAEFLVASKELEARLQLDVLIDGKVRKTVNITPEALFTFDDRLQLSGDEVAAGKHTIQLRKRGTGALYYSAYLTNFTREDPIAAAGLELRVSRRIFRLIPEPHSDLVEGSRGQAVRQRELKYRREPIVNLAEMPAGQLVEIELIIESKNDYDHVVLTDPKAAGVEPIDQTSGYNGNALGAYMEVRDDRVVLYASEIARGRHSVSYRARTERPGRYSAMPASAEGMYAPELRANSDELKVVIEGEHEKNAG